MTRDEAHVLLDAVLDVNSSQNRYDVCADFTNNYDGTPMAVFYVHDNSVTDSAANNGVVESFTVSDYSKTAWEAVKALAKYKGGGDTQ